MVNMFQFVQQPIVGMHYFNSYKAKKQKFSLLHKLATGCRTVSKTWLSLHFYKWDSYRLE